MKAMKIHRFPETTKKWRIYSSDNVSIFYRNLKSCIPCSIDTKDNAVLSDKE